MTRRDMFKRFLAAVAIAPLAATAADAKPSLHYRFVTMPNDGDAERLRRKIMNLYRGNDRRPFVILPRGQKCSSPATTSP